MYSLNGSGGAKTGLGITLKVMAGDKIDIWGNSYYAQNNTSGTNNNVPVTDILSGLLGTPTAATAGKGATTALLNTPGSTVIPSAFLTRTPVAGDQVPNAAINYIFFDEQFKYISGGYSRVGGAGLKTDHHNSLSGIAVPKNGYVYVYVSNQSPVEVLFDNLQVIHTRGPLLETDNYYPFGLVQSGISSQAAGKLDNKLKYNKGSELQNKEFSDGSGLETYTTQFRMLDPQLGRWWQVDPKADSVRWSSPFVTMDNNPISKNDPFGDTTRVYVETSGAGHVWISTGEGDKMTVYSFGRYAGTNPGSGFSILKNGPGVLLKLQGKDAAAYNQKKFDQTGATVFKINDVKDEAINKTMDALFNSSSKLPEKGEYKNNPNAHVVSDYRLIENNCTTTVCGALNQSGSSALQDDASKTGSNQTFVIPASLKSFLNWQASSWLGNHSVTVQSVENPKEQTQ